MDIPIFQIFRETIEQDFESKEKLRNAQELKAKLKLSELN